MIIHANFKVVTYVLNHILLFLQELTPECMEEVDRTFQIFDKDGSAEIDRDEALKHWKSSFGKLSAREFFNQVDFDGDG